MGSDLFYDAEGNEWTGDQIEECLRTPLSARATTWIPVSERLPMDTSTVLFVSDGRRLIGHYAADHWWAGDEVPEIRVTHWMELPGAPADETASKE